MPLRHFIAPVLLGFLFAVDRADAQCSANTGTCNTTLGTTLSIGTLVQLAMSTSATALTSPTADQVDIGATIADAGPTFTIKANRSWTMNIKSGNATNWTYVGSSGGVKPIGQLTWSNAVAGTFTAITATDAILASGAASTAGSAAAVFFRTIYPAGFTNAANAPGTYSLPVVFTLTAP